MQVKRTNQKKATKLTGAAAGSLARLARQNNSHNGNQGKLGAGRRIANKETIGPIKGTSQIKSNQRMSAKPRWPVRTHRTVAKTASTMLISGSNCTRKGGLPRPWLTSEVVCSIKVRTCHKTLRISDPAPMTQG
jgi:hypothetical protein